jgi:ribosomal protein L37AE/L43A
MTSHEAPPRERDEKVERAVPYHCPFCAEEDLRPLEGGRWHCRSCLRVFALTFYGLQKPDIAHFGSETS